LQKSKDKNTALEDQHRRNEISMRRKQAQTANPLSPTAMSSDSDAPKSPASTGAMDDLLQKLRAAKPEARDQRDRRRRARLKDRHQVRVASGQEIPEVGVNVEEGGAEEGEGGKEVEGVLSPTSEAAESEAGSVTATAAATAGSEADIADRAAAMLEGLQSGSGLNKDGSLSVRRRRESADTERQRRRNRRQQASSARSDDGGLMSPSTIQEEGEGQADGAGDEGGSVMSGDGQGTPTTVVHPPSPEQKGRELPTPPPE
jgi:cytokinesis protein